MFHIQDRPLRGPGNLPARLGVQETLLREASFPGAARRQRISPGGGPDEAVAGAPISDVILQKVVPWCVQGLAPGNASGS